MNSTRSYTLQDIFIYPIKSLGGIALGESLAQERGLQFDRRWMLIDRSNNFLTQRKISDLALIKVSLHKEVIRIKHINKDLPFLEIPLEFSSFKLQNVTIWSNQVLAPVLDDKIIQQWFYEAMGEEVRLVFMDDKVSRPVDPEYALNGEEVSFADGYPFLITNQASLEELNSRLQTPVPILRFRPNLVVSGAQPFEEDHWNEIRAGSAIFKVVKPCGRCVVTTIDTQTAEKGAEPLRTLATYRKFGNKIIFGQNMVLVKPGKILKGEEITISYR